MKVGILIIGSGLAGTIAYNSLRPFSPVVVDLKPGPPKGGILGLHPAVMRFRDQKAAELIRAEYEEVLVSKEIFLDGKILKSASIRANNLYSQKVYGAIGRRSLSNLGDVRRFILLNGYPAPEHTLWNRMLTKVKDNVAYFQVKEENGGRTEAIEYDWLISTIPMPTIYKLCFGESSLPEDTFPSRSVYIKRVHLNIPSYVNQTIYFPDFDTPIYRITIQNRDMIFESMESVEGSDLLYTMMNHYDQFLSNLIYDSFGISEDYYSLIEKNIVRLPIGKIIPMDEDLRLKIIMSLTDKHKILSFGRFSVWRPLRTDQLLDDIKKISRLISAKRTKAAYISRIS